MNELKPISTDIKALDMNLNYGELYFENGDTFTIHIESNYEDDFYVEEQNNCLHIFDKRKEKRFPFRNRTLEHSMIKLTIPTDYSFEKIQITTGAGEVYADKIQTARLQIKMSAGEFHIKDLFVSESCNIDGGAGEIWIDNGSIHNLSMNFGAGEVHIHTAITGNSKISAGVGELHLALLGNPNDYSATISKGIGHCRISGFTNSHSGTYGDGPNKLRISGGIGEIHVSVENNDLAQ